MKTKALIIPMALAVITFALGCDKNDDNDISSRDRNFVMKANMANFAEIDAGQLAAAKATDPGIKAFGQQMVMDHTQSKSELKNIATSLGLYAPDSLDAEHMALKSQLMSLSGAKFDSVYIHSQVKDHNMAIDLYDDEGDDGNNRQLRDYARNTLPHLREHKAKADSLATKF
jgi:putative membrane protein